jgi:hypothetical protein
MLCVVSRCVVECAGLLAWQWQFVSAVCAKKHNDDIYIYIVLAISIAITVVVCAARLIFVGLSEKSSLSVAVW